MYMDNRILERSESILDKSSELIKALMKTKESAFIIYPGVITNEIKNEISKITK